MRLPTAVLERLAGPPQAGPGTSTSVERRRELRTRFSGQATIIRCAKGANRAPLVVSIRDVSEHGIGIRCAQPLHTGERFILVLPREMAQIARAVVCTVANWRPASGGGFDIGASFAALVRAEAGPKPGAPTAAAPAAPSLPVDQVINSFRAQPNERTSHGELDAIESMARLSERSADEGAGAPSPAHVAGAKRAVVSSPPPPIPQAPRAAGEIPRLLTREECVKRAEQAVRAPTLSGIVAQVLTLAASPRGDLAELASLVARDPMLSARVLQAANSAGLTSSRGIVSTIPEAVRNIGCANVRNIAASLGVFDAMPASGADGFNPIRCWQHSFGVATLCQRLAPEAESGLAYMVGLCHDLGEILFRTHFGAEYQKMLEVHSATGKPRQELERTMLGIAHNELVATILRCLRLPDTIRTPVEQFHAAGPSGSALANPLARLLRIAEFYANGLLLASSGQSPLSPLSRPECRTALGREAPDRPDGTSFRGEILGLTAMLARLSAKDEADLMAPLYPAKPLRILLVRDPFYSAFDPIQAALESLCEVAPRPSLPARQELNGFAGIVVVARSTTAGGFSGPEIAQCVGDALSVLWLAGRIDAGATADAPHLTPTSLPVSLSRVGEFIQSLQTPG